MPSAKTKKKAAKRMARKSAPAKRKSRALHDKRYPNERLAYRAARNKLLAAEMKLRDQTEVVAALRRKLPLGGEIAEDYVFDELDAQGAMRRVRFSQLFAPGKDTLVVYNFMFGPTMKEACPSCTSILDAIDGSARHLSDRINLVIVAKSPIPRIVDFARERGWRHLRLLSSAGNSYNRTYFGEQGDDQWPMLNVFVRRNGKIHHTWGTELFHARPRPGQHPRHVDMIWPIWNVLDLTPEGRGTTWNPRLSYTA